MKNYFILFLAIISLPSCEDAFNQVVEVKLPPYTPSIVLGCQLNNDNTPSMNVTNTKQLVGGATIKSLRNAGIQIFENGLEKGVWTYVNNPIDLSDSLFTNNSFIPVPGNIYKTVVKSTGYNDVEAVDTMPTLIPYTLQKTGKLKFIKQQDLGGGFEELDTLAEMKITFNDPLGKDFYRIIARRLNSNITDGKHQSRNGGGGPGFGRPENFYSTDATFADAQSNNGGPSLSGSDNYFDINNFYFDDKYFDGKTTTLTIWAPVKTTIIFDFINQTEQIVVDKYYIGLQHHSRSSYYHNKSLQAYEGTDGNPFSQPVPIYTNVKSGYGIFCASSTKVDSISLK
jgi:hypothetical protein